MKEIKPNLKPGDSIQCRDSSDIWHTFQHLHALDYKMQVSFMEKKIYIKEVPANDE